MTWTVHVTINPSYILPRFNLCCATEAFQRRLISILSSAKTVQNIDQNIFYIRKMETILKDKTYTTQEYFEIEEGSDVRHGFINGQLFEMPGATKKHHFTIQRIERFLANLFEVKGYLVYRETMKVKITGEQKYYYPDIFITKETSIEDEPYVCHQPELIVEVSYKSAFRSDAVDKLIAYQKLDTLKYYLIVDPENIEVLVYTKDNEGGWLSEAFHNKTAIVYLKKWEVVLPLEAVYP